MGCAVPPAGAQFISTIQTSSAGEQDQTVTLTGASTLDAGVSITQTLHGRYTGQATGGMGDFTLNGKRCDVTIILGAAPVPEATAT